MKYENPTFQVGGYRKTFADGYAVAFEGVCDCTCHTSTVGDMNCDDSPCCAPCVTCHADIRDDADARRAHKRHCR